MTASSARDLVTTVLGLAVGSSITPFVPLPFVDDYILARLLRQIAKKVMEKRGAPGEEATAKAIVDAYVDAGNPPLGTKALTAAARFVVRKVAVVLDVKKSHDVFGEAIAFALAVDVAMELGALSSGSASYVGAAVYRATQSVGSAALEVMTRAGREAFAAHPSTDGETRYARVSEAIGRQVDDARAHLAHVLTYELSRPSP